MMVQTTKKLLNLIMIARNVNTFWWDEQIVKLRPHTDKHLNYPMSIAFADRINRYDEELRGDMIRKN